MLLSGKNSGMTTRFAIGSSLYFFHFRVSQSFRRINLPLKKKEYRCTDTIKAADIISKRHDHQNFLPSESLAGEFHQVMTDRHQS
jgi:hypothetical protein